MTIHEQIEQIIDSSSVPALMIVIEDVCHGKAEHIRTNWQDEQSAAVWERFARAIHNTKCFWKTWN